MNRAAGGAHCFSETPMASSSEDIEERTKPPFKNGWYTQEMLLRYPYNCLADRIFHLDGDRWPRTTFLAVWYAFGCLHRAPACLSSWIFVLHSRNRPRPCLICAERPTVS